jgi:FixJ family two-component response regulator
MQSGDDQRDPDVFVLDDDRDVAESLCDTIRVFCGRASLAVVSYEEMLSRAQRVLRSKTAILDINLGPDRPSGLDAYRWLREHDYPGSVVFLTGHAHNHPLVGEARRLGNARVIQKPIELQGLLKLFES